MQEFNQYVLTDFQIAQLVLISLWHFLCSVLNTTSLFLTFLPIQGAQKVYEGITSYGLVRPNLISTQKIAKYCNYLHKGLSQL